MIAFMYKLLALACCMLLGMSGFAQKIDQPTNPVPLQPGQGIYQKLSLQLPSDAGAAEVKAALLELKPIVAALGCDLQLRDAIESPGGWHYNFEQTWQGIPLYQAQVKATLTKTKRFMNLLNNLQSFAGVPAQHQRSDAQLAADLPDLLDEGHADFNLVEHQQQYLLVDGQLFPCHRIVYTANTQSWEILLADDDLHELLRRDLAAYRKPGGITSTDTTGNAYVFNPDPLTTSGQPYGGNYSDNNDADHADLNAQRVMVTLRDLTYDGSQFVLTGPYVNIADREAPTVAPATSLTGNFLFTRSQQGFEDAMVYYHIDTMQRYVQSLGFNNLMNSSLKADPHGVNGQDNSHFVPAGVDTRLGFGEGGVDDAEDADVIIHEYGHALNSGTERQGLDEGIGDYFAASYSRGLSYTFWKNTFTWDGHNEFWPGRNASLGTLYPPGGSDIYLYGQIWASVLMEVYPQIGKTNSDKVVLQSLYGHASNMLLSDAALVILDADSLLFGGAHHNQYQEAFCTRGILSGSMVGEPCFVATGDAQSQENIDWGLFPNPATTQVTLVIDGPVRAPQLGYTITDLMGRVLRQADMHGQSATIDLSGLAPSIYLVQVHASNGWTSTKRLLVE
jgi:hypothetical protein